MCLRNLLGEEIHRRGDLKRLYDHTTESEGSSSRHEGRKSFFNSTLGNSCQTSKYLDVVTNKRDRTDDSRKIHLQINVGY